MHLEVRATNFSLQPGVRDYIEGRFSGAVEHFNGRVSQMRVTLSNLHGRNHVRELQCVVHASLRHAEDAVIEQVDADLITAVDLASGRLKRTVRRHINRQRDMRRERRSPVVT